MRGYETARQIIERQRAAVKALAEELLQEESVDAERLRDILARSVLPSSTFPPAVRDALNEARLHA
jgi:ATP-dependent Zn protease